MTSAGSIILNILSITFGILGTFSILSMSTGRGGRRWIPAVIRLVIGLLFLWVAHFLVHASIDLGS